MPYGTLFLLSQCQTNSEGAEGEGSPKLQDKPCTLRNYCLLLTTLTQSRAVNKYLAQLLSVDACLLAR